MAQPVIYLDKSMLLNFSMDFLILYLTARLSRYRTNPGRLVTGSLLGSIYVLVVFLPEVSFLYTMAAKFLYSCVIVGVCFYPWNLKKFLSVLVYFYAVSFALGGAIYGLAAMSMNLTGSSDYEILRNLIAQTGNFIDVFVWGFPLSLLFWFTAGRWGWGRIRHSLSLALFRFPVKLRFGDVEVGLQGLVDTGNRLRDPLTGVPVVVIEAKSLLPFLPQDFHAAMKAMDLDAVQKCLNGTQWQERLRLVPFSSVGKSNGLMLAFMPDALELHTPNGSITSKRAIIGLSDKELSADAAFQALVHPDLLPAAG